MEFVAEFAVGLLLWLFGEWGLKKRSPRNPALAIISVTGIVIMFLTVFNLIIGK